MTPPHTSLDADKISQQVRDATPKHGAHNGPAQGGALEKNPVRAVALATANRAALHLGMAVRAIEPYGPDSPHSYFQDLVRSHTNVNRDRLALDRIARHRAVIEQARAEQRAVGTGTLGAIVPGASGLPLWVAEAFAAAARSAAPLYTALDAVPMPEQGLSVPIAKTTVAGTAAVQTENSPVALGSLTVALDSEPISTIASGYQYSFQSSDRGGAPFDRMVAADLGAQWYALLEFELFQGTGSGGRIRGLDAMTAGTNVTVTSQIFSTAAGGQLASVWNAYQQVALALGQPPDLTVVAERRLAWWQSQSPNVAVTSILPGTVVASPGAATNLGGGTEDWVFLVNRASMPLFTSAYPDGPTLEVDAQASGSTLTADVTVRAYAAFATNRRPEGVGIVKGITAAGTTF